MCSAIVQANAHATHARIGPNAIIRMAEALRIREGDAAATDVFAAAGLARYLHAPPGAMVDEAEVTALYAALHGRLDAGAARAAGREAGERTAAYLLAHRIPRPVQALLHVLPPMLASRVLLGAIRRHAWTFAGSGRFSVAAGRPLRLAIAGCPLCRGLWTDAPACDFYAGTFARLFATLVSRRTVVREITCTARGDAACVFAIDWRRPPTPG